MPESSRMDPGEILSEERELVLQDAAAAAALASDRRDAGDSEVLAWSDEDAQEVKAEEAVEEDQKRKSTKSYRDKIRTERVNRQLSAVGQCCKKMQCPSKFATPQIVRIRDEFHKMPPQTDRRAKLQTILQLR